MIENPKVRAAYEALGQLSTEELEELLQICKRSWYWVDWDVKPEES